MRTWLSRHKGFTMVEIMIVIAVIGLVAAIAMPAFVNARTRAQTNICISNLKKIVEAKAMWAMWEGASSYDEPGWDELVPDYLKKMPGCPANGTYTIGVVDADPTCSISGHKLSG